LEDEVGLSFSTSILIFGQSILIGRAPGYRPRVPASRWRAGMLRDRKPTLADVSAWAARPVQNFLWQSR
jgi:hypothetical protein